MPPRKLLAYAAIYVLWGGSFLAIRIVVAVIPPFCAAGFRFTLAGAVLLLGSRSRYASLWQPRQILSATALGLLMFALMYAGLFWAETRIASGLAAVVSAMIPIWIFSGEVFLLRTQRATPLSLGGITLGFAGVALLALRSSGSVHSSTLAVLAALGGTLSWSAGTIWSRHLNLPRPQAANSGWQMFTGGLLLLSLAAISGEFRHIPPVRTLFSFPVLASMAYLVIAASIVSYTAYVWLIAHESPTRVSSYAYVNPVFALIVGAALAGERLAVFQVVGAVLVVAGVFATLTGKSSAVPAAGGPIHALPPSGRATRIGWHVTSRMSSVKSENPQNQEGSLPVNPRRTAPK